MDTHLRRFKSTNETKTSHERIWLSELSPIVRYPPRPRGSSCSGPRSPTSEPDLRKLWQTVRFGYLKETLFPELPTGERLRYRGEQSEFQGRQDGHPMSYLWDQIRLLSIKKEGHFCSECVETEAWQTPPGLPGPENLQWQESIESECDVCGRKIRWTPCRFKGNTVLCSKKCHNLGLSEAFTGAGHANWKGGGSRNYG